MPDHLFFMVKYVLIRSQRYLGSSSDIIAPYEDPVTVLNLSITVIVCAEIA